MKIYRQFFLVLALALMSFANVFAAEAAPTSADSVGANKTMIEVKIEMPDLTDLVKEKGEEILLDVTERTAGRMRDKLNEPKSGSQYARGNSIHIASAPGEAPANDSDNLINSVMPNLNTITLNDYGWYLDQGISRSGRTSKTKIVGPVKNFVIAARPWIMPSLDEVVKEFNESGASPV